MTFTILDVVFIASASAIVGFLTACLLAAGKVKQPEPPIWEGDLHDF